MTPDVPALLESTSLTVFDVLDKREHELLHQARRLFDSGFYDHPLLDVWNAAVNNLRR